MNGSPNPPRWGATPWTIDFRPARQELPAEVDFAVVGGGFTGLAAAAWLRRIAPEKSVALLESGAIGAGASGHTGGLALAETAAGDMPGLGDVLAGFSDTLRELRVDCDLHLPGVWELARHDPLPHSPIAWNDSGDLRAVAEVPGGTIDPGKMVSGLARAAEQRGALIFEYTRVEDVEFGETRPAENRRPGASRAASAFRLQRAIARDQRLGWHHRSEVHAGHGHGAVHDGAIDRARTCLGKAVLHGGDAVSVGPSLPRTAASFSAPASCI